MQKFNGVYLPISKVALYGSALLGPRWDFSAGLYNCTQLFLLIKYSTVKTVSVQLQLTAQQHNYYTEDIT